MPQNRENDPRPRPDAAQHAPGCPVCGQAVAPDATHFPFCSKRCKLIDLGRWLGGYYRIETPLEATDREAPPEAHGDSEGTR